MRFMYLPVAPGGQGCISMLPAAVAAHDTPSRGSAGHFGASGRQGRTSVLKIIVREASCKNFQSGLMSRCSRGQFGLVQSSILSITETHSYET